MVLSLSARVTLLSRMESHLWKVEYLVHETSTRSLHACALTHASTWLDMRLLAGNGQLSGPIQKGRNNTAPIGIEPIVSRVSTTLNR